MEQVHGVDVSWMTQGSPKDKFNKASIAPSKTPGPAQPRQIPISESPRQPSPQTTTETASNGQSNGRQEPMPINGSTPLRRLSRSGSVENKNSPNGTPPHRRNSWFSNISAKFSGSSNSPSANGTAHQQPQSPQQPQHLQQQSQQQHQSPTAQSDPIVPKITPTKNAVLQHGAKPEGDAPYTPAPPKSGQAGFLGVFRRLSSSGGNLGSNVKQGHGLVERKILNVDQNRERCPITELKDSKLRRVSFYVDVEIAPMPKYADGEAQSKPLDQGQKKKMAEKGEGAALKNPKAAEAAKDALIESTGGSNSQELETSVAASNEAKLIDSVEDIVCGPGKEKEMTRKKEKKKRSEEERKARKEKRRKLAEDNGSIPMEIHCDSSDSSDSPGSTGSPKLTAFPTTNPVRVYRRCCQLRETPILKKITEQLNDSANTSSATGFVNKLDLTGYFMQFPDLVTLGDYLAIVPVREIILENTGLNDEGLRVILAGLLAAKRPGLLRRKKSKSVPEQHEQHGGIVERVVLKDNKLGPDGWKHISLFTYKCRSLKYLDLSSIPFPRQPTASNNGSLQIPLSISDIFSKALAERPAGSTLEIVNIGETEPSMDQFGTIIDGVIQCGVRRLGVARNHLDKQGLQHVARYLEAGNCEGLDLGGNDLLDQMEVIVASIKDGDPLWALGLSGCNLNPSSLSKILPVLVKLQALRFIDLSHNHDLFQSTPSAVGLLRRYMPKMEPLKRLHLQDVNMTPEQAIAILEIVPEAHNLCHLNLLGNTELASLADAKTEEAQEEACALYASLMAAARLSKSMICVDIEVPSEEAGEIVKAMAKQVVAYCLRNMERMHDTEISVVVASALSETQGEAQECKSTSYPDVIVHLVGHNVLADDEPVDDDDSGPDEDYVIGGTGVVKALTCCLKNRGDESQRLSGEFSRDVDGNEVPSSGPSLATGGKAKDFSKHLLAGARKIRLRIQPALNKAKANPSDEQNLRKLTFLDDTLQGIIKRFEDEFPDTREPAPIEIPQAPTSKNEAGDLSTSPPASEDAITAPSDGEDESAIHSSKPLSRSNSVLSKVLAEEEGRVHRVGHRFRSGFTEQIDLLATIDDMTADPNHIRFLTELAEDVGGELLAKVKEKGAVRAFKEDKDILFKCMKESDPEYWERFVDAQRKARANINVPAGEKNGEVPQQHEVDESAIAD